MFNKYLGLYGFSASILSYFFQLCLFDTIAARILPVLYRNALKNCKVSLTEHVPLCCLLFPFDSCDLIEGY